MNRKPRGKSAPSKVVQALILEILDSKTDTQRGLTINEIKHHLDTALDENGYGKPDYCLPTLKTVSRHLKELEQTKPLGTIISRLDSMDLNGNKRDQPGWHIEYNETLGTEMFDAAEIRLLADSLALSRMKDDMRDDLLAKLKQLPGASRISLDHLNHISQSEHYGGEFFFTIDMVCEALESGKLIKFKYNTFGADGCLHPRTNKNGKAREYVIEPFQMVYKNGRYFLVGRRYGTNNKPDNNPSFYRIDRISDAHLKAARAAGGWKALKASNEASGPLEYMTQRPYPYAGEAVDIQLLSKGGLDAVFDWFHDPVVIEERLNTSTHETEYLVSVTAEEQSTAWLVLQYGGALEVLAPSSLRETVAKMAYEVYLEHTYN